MFSLKEKFILNNLKKEVFEIKKIVNKYSKLNKNEILKLHEQNISNFNINSSIALIMVVIEKTINIKLYDTQLIASLLINKNNVIEMKTGEGKTLVPFINTYINYLQNKKTFIVTANEYLAKRDAELSNKVFNYFNLEVSFVNSDFSTEDKKIRYSNSIASYSTINNIIFDYLRNNLAATKDQIVFDKLDSIIIDEIDFSLIDEAIGEKSISGEKTIKDLDYYKFNRFSENFIDGDHYESFKVGNKRISLKDSFYNKLEDLLIENKIIKENKDLYNNLNIKYVDLIKNAILANICYENGKDYIIRNNNICIINEKNGRAEDGVKLLNGLHQAIEAKEKLSISSEKNSLSSISIQNFVRKFDNISGMTGTAKTDQKEFKEIYNLDVISIPTNKKIKRIDNDDLIFFSYEEKMKHIISDIKKNHSIGRPILIGTSSVEFSEKISELLKTENIPHNILNAKNNEKEAEIISNSGKLGSVLIATKMAGRGTDIKLAGDIEEYYKKYESKTIDEIEKIYQNDKNKIMELGGLLIIGAERLEIKRLDNQLIGRAGRQGEEGETQFYISLEDDLFVKTNQSEMLKRTFKTLGLEKGAGKNKMITKSINRIQSKIDANHYDNRKNTFIFDDIINEQRDLVFRFRKDIMNIDSDEKLFNFISYGVKSHASKIYNKKSFFSDNDIKSLNEHILTITGINLDLSNIKNFEEDNFVDLLEKEFLIRLKKIIVSEKRRNEVILYILSYLDINWSKQINSINNIRKNTSMRVYAQEKPIDEYKKEMFNSFLKVIQNFEEDCFTMLLNNNYTKTSDDMAEMNEKEFFNYFINNISRSFVGISPLVGAGV